jgi:hypothetical protein
LNAKTKARILPILTLTLIATILGVAVALWSTQVPVHNTITITGTRELKAYKSTAYTVLFNGIYNYADSPSTTIKVNSPQVIYLKNTGAMSLSVTWNATAVPTGITIMFMRSNVDAHDTWTAFPTNTPLTLNAGETVDVAIDLATSSVAFGTYSWDTIIYAVQA